MSFLSILSFVVSFLGPTQNAIKKYISIPELFRSIVTALVAGGGLIGVLLSIQSHLGVIVLDPQFGTVAGVVVFFLIDCARRFEHDAKNPPKPTPKSELQNHDHKFKI